MTVISRITGLLREMTFAYYLGASAGMDAFNSAYRIPNFFRCLFGEGAFSQAFVPMLAEYREKRTAAEVQDFLNHIAGSMISVLFTLTIIAVLITPWLVCVFAPGFIHDAYRFNLTASMLRITFPYILFVSLTAYVSGILNTYGKFGIPAFAPNLLNLALILAAIFLAPYFSEPTLALAWGIFVGGALQLIVQLPALYRLNLMPRPRILWSDPGVKRVLKLMTSAIFGVSVAQVSFLVDVCLASFLPIGSINWLNYSNRLALLPLGIFSVAIATVILPHLSREHAAASHQEFSLALDFALRFILIIALPAVIGLTILSGPIVATLFQFQHGKFSPFDVMMVQRSLLGFALGIPAFMLVKVLASGFYSRQNIKTPVKIATIALLSNIVLAVILIFPLKHAGLALATSLTSTLNAALLFWTTRREKHYHPQAGWKIFWLHLLVANALLALFLWLTTANLEIWLSWSSFHRVWHLALLCGSAIFIYLLSLYLSGMRLQEFLFREK